MTKPKPRVPRTKFQKKAGYVFWNWLFSLVFAAIAYVAFLQYHTVENSPDVASGAGNLLLAWFPLACVTGLLGAGIAMGISGYGGWMGGVAGLVRLCLMTFIFACFGFFGLKAMLLSLGPFWALVIYAIIVFATRGWANDAGRVAGLRAGHKFGGVS